MIYCVEDDAGIRDLVVYTLQNTGMEARGFSDGAALTAALRGAKPDLILLDIMLPGEDGISILRRLRSLPDTAAIPVILLTAKNTEYDKVVGLDSGGQPLDDGHVHRSALVCAAAGQEPGSPVTPATLACLVEHPEGLFRNCPAGCRRLVFANKGDGPGALDAASEAAALSRSVAWFAGSAAQGWCVPLTAGAQRALGMEPFRDLPC